MTTPSTQPSSSSFYNDLGKTSALPVEASISSLKSSLDNVYGIFSKREQNLTAQRVQQYETEKDALLLVQGGQKAKLSEQEVLLKFKKEEIQDKENELANVRAGEPDSDFVPLGISSLFLFALSLYLIVFYSSTGYSAFIDIPPGLIAGFLAPDVYSQAQGGVLAFIIFFPFIFFAVGYAVHIFIERKQSALAIALLGFTLIFDALLAYNISKRVHTKGMNNGDVKIAWAPDMAIRDGTFYLIIFSGFAAYLLWGFLLNYVLNEWKRIQPDKLKQTAIDSLRQQILNLTSESADFENQVSQTKSTLDKAQRDIEILTEKINRLNGGGIVVNVPALQGAIGDFMGGWLAFIMFRPNPPDVIEQKMEEAKQTANDWLNEKLKTFDNLDND